MMYTLPKFDSVKAANIQNKCLQKLIVSSGRHFTRINGDKKWMLLVSAVTDGRFYWHYPKNHDSWFVYQPAKSTSYHRLQSSDIFILKDYYLFFAQLSAYKS